MNTYLKSTSVHLETKEKQFKTKIVRKNNKQSRFVFKKVNKRKRKINETESWFLEWAYEIDKILARLIKKKKARHRLTISEMKEEHHF